MAWLQGDPNTRYSARGVIAIDNTLVDHAGKLIEDVGWFWDHANERYLIAHNYLIPTTSVPRERTIPLSGAGSGSVALVLRGHSKTTPHCVSS